MLTNLPLYFKCAFSDKTNKKVVSTYKIDSTDNNQYPFQLHKLSAERGAGWQSLSIYAGASDAVSVLLKELFDEELSDEMYQGQAAVDAVAIVERLNQGDRIVSIYDESNSEVFRLEYEIAVDDIVMPKRKRLIRQRENR